MMTRREKCDFAVSDRAGACIPPSRNVIEGEVYVIGKKIRR